MNFSAHQKRLYTAAALLPLLALGCVAGGWWLFGMILAASSLGLWEFYGLFWSGLSGLGKKGLGLGLGALLLLAAKQENPHYLIAVVLLSFWIGNFFFLYWYSRRPGQANYANAAILLAGLLYLPLTLQFFLFFDLREIALVLLAAMVSDTAAYYVGGRLGRHPVWPAISPKKTWEGSLGGMAACVLLAGACGAAMGPGQWWAWMLLGLWLNLAAQMGDFFESALKRWQAVKDSGSILPGHGGLLDRIDSLLLVVPAYATARNIWSFFP